MPNPPEAFAPPPDLPEQNRKERIKRPSSPEEKSVLQNAKELFRENREAMSRAVQRGVEAYNTYEKRFANVTARPDFRETDGFRRFFRDPSIQAMFDLYNTGDDRVKAFIHLQISEMFDRATNGQPIQFTLRRMFLRLALRDIRDAGGNEPRNAEEFQKVLRAAGLATMGTTDALADHEITEFFRENNSRLSKQVRGGIESSGLAIALRTKSDQPLLNASARLKATQFYDSTEIQVMQELYRRMVYAERSEERDRRTMRIRFQSYVRDLVRTSTLTIPLSWEEPELGTLVSAILEPDR